jgi:putative ABC transport system permease protein
MLRNFITLAWRTLLRNKLHSLINISGLAVGVSSCLVIYLIVSYELSFNKGFQAYDHIYRIHSSFDNEFNSGVATATGDAVKSHFKGVQDVASIYSQQLNVLIPKATGNISFEREKGIIFTDSSFFEVFDAYTWLAGSAKELNKPFTVVLTESRAKLYFGTSDINSIIGKEIIYHDSVSTTVAGIVNDLPFNSDIDFTDFIGTASVRNSEYFQQAVALDNWHYENGGSQLFVRLEEETNPDDIQTQLPVLDKFYKDHSSTGNPHFSNNKHNLQPLNDLHYNAELEIFSHSGSPAHLPTLYALTCIAILLLLIGSINFINLETARAFNRAKEVGVRKVLGSTQRKLIVQFLTESFIITSLAVLLALPLCELALNFFKEFVPAGVELNIVELIFPLLILLAIVSLLAGLYPAFVLSAFNPAKVLKNQVSAGGLRTAALRKALIVFQFTFAQMLIIVTLIIGWQIDFLHTKDLGFTKEAIVYFFAPKNSNNPKILKTELEKIPEIQNVSLSWTPAAHRVVSYTYIYHDQAGERIQQEVCMRAVDENFLNVYDIQLIAGKNLLPIDTAHEVLINETLLKKLGFTNAAEAVGYPVAEYKKVLVISGVVKDFHLESLHTPVEPVMLIHSQNSSCLNVKLTPSEGQSLTAVLTKIEKAWKRIYPEDPLKVSFLDESINNFYQAEQRTSKLVITATSMAIFISCLGLWGLASYSVVQRTKEIGIRKILGATGRAIILLLSKDFVVLVMLAFAFACPLAWIAGNMWLENFAYHIEINAWIFLLTITGALFIMFATIGYQTVKAASTNPVDSLRNE